MGADGCDMLGIFRASSVSFFSVSSWRFSSSAMLSFRRLPSSMSGVRSSALSFPFMRSAFALRAARSVFKLLQELVPLVVEPHDEVRVRGHVPVRNVRPDRLDIVTDELQIEHAGIIAES